MSTVSRRFTFIVDNDVRLDVEDVLREDPAEAAVILAAIEDLKGDRLLCERLVEVEYEDTAIRSVKEFAALQRARYNVLHGSTVRGRSLAADHSRRSSANVDQTAIYHASGRGL